MDEMGKSETFSPTSLQRPVSTSLAQALAFNEWRGETLFISLLLGGQTRSKLMNSVYLMSNM